MSDLAPPTAGLNQHLLRLSAILQLQAQARLAGEAELGFIVVNETAGVVPYAQAALWRAASRNLVLSGAGAADQDAPYAVWLRRLCTHLAARADGAGLRMLTAADVAAPIAADWAAHMPSYAMWCPLCFPDGRVAGALLLARPDPFAEADAAVLQALTGSYAQALAWHTLQRRARLPHSLTNRRRLALLVLLLAVIGVGLLPIRSSILAPAEIVPAEPTPVRAPFAGVVDSILVAPNATVHAGDPLLVLDTTQLASRVEVAKKALEFAQVEYAQVAREAVADTRARGRMALLKSKMEQQEAELGYQQSLLGRARVTAPTEGVAVFNDASEWIGRPVELGERIMVLAPPSSRLVELQVPVAEIATFEPGAPVQFFGNLSPDQPVTAQLNFASYSSAVGADGVMAYVFRAQLDEAAPPQRLGLKGTGKVYGERRPLALWLLRRPLATLRQWLAL